MLVLLMTAGMKKIPWIYIRPCVIVIVPVIHVHTRAASPQNKIDRYFGYRHFRCRVESNFSGTRRAAEILTVTSNRIGC
jgi:hypothetical protein